MTLIQQPTISAARRQAQFAVSPPVKTLRDVLPLVDAAALRATPRSIYLHIPFCFHKCHYCDFYSVVDRDDRQAAFTQRLIDELQAAAHAGLLAAPVRTIFVGGGTPTLLRTDLWERLLVAVHEVLRFAPGFEFTVEANPETVTSELLRTLVRGGVNRTRVGAQSFNPTHLQMLERRHDPANVGRAFDLARAAGIDNLNLDLIFGVPRQTLDDWRQDLDRAAALRPEHVSCYALTYEPNTALTARLQAGAVERVDEDVEAEMFTRTRAALLDAGFEAYEISNFARPGRECRHNLAYWRDEDWLAFGPAAAGHWGGWRWKNAPRLGEYLASSGFPPLAEAEHAAPATRLAERLLMGLRLAEGVDAAAALAQAEAFDDGGGAAARRLAALAAEFITQGQLELTPAGRWRISPDALLLADTIIGEMMAAASSTEAS